MSVTADPVQEQTNALLKPREGGPKSGRRWFLPLVLTLISLIWLFPLLLALVNSFRDYAYTSTHGYVSWGGFTLDNYKNAWAQGDFGLHFWNSFIITVPAVLLTLFLSSCVAFVVARFSWKINIALLGFFLAANLLPRRRCSSRSTGCSGRSRCRSGSASRARCSTASRA